MTGETEAPRYYEVPGWGHIVWCRADLRHALSLETDVERKSDLLTAISATLRWLQAAGQSPESIEADDARADEYRRKRATEGRTA